MSEMKLSDIEIEIAIAKTHIEKHIYSIKDYLRRLESKGVIIVDILEWIKKSLNLI
jgi:hypothetical protein